MKRAHAYKCPGSQREVEALDGSLTIRCAECGQLVALRPIVGERWARFVAMHAAPAQVVLQ